MCPAPEAVAARLDGKALAAAIREEVKARCLELPSGTGRPGLGVIQVGSDPASSVYVGHKIKACEEVGFLSRKIALEEGVSDQDVLQAVEDMNRDPAIHGILVQLPLPSALNERLVLEAIDPAKDVDGFHPVNVGALHSGLPGFAPCTPRGVITLLQREEVPLEGCRALVIGRSNIVGKPMGALLLKANATVTMAHSRTKDLESLVRESDLVVAAVGRPGFVRPEWVHGNQVLVDVGISRIEDHALAEDLFREAPKRLAGFEKRGHALVGDIHPAAFSRCARYTPVPGGVGPLTIASLLENTFDAWKNLTSP